MPSENFQKSYIASFQCELKMDSADFIFVFFQNRVRVILLSGFCLKEQDDGQASVSFQVFFQSS